MGTANFLIIISGLILTIWGMTGIWYITTTNLVDQHNSRMPADGYIVIIISVIMAVAGLTLLTGIDL